MFEIIIDVTNKCFLNCELCGTNASTIGKKHLQVEYIEKVLMNEGNCLFYLGGGCFFCHPHFRDILQFIKKERVKNVVIDVPLCLETLELIRMYPMSEYGYKISVSLWGIGSTHDKLSNYSGFKYIGQFSEIMHEHQGNAAYSFVLTKDLLMQKNEVMRFIQGLQANDSVYFHRLMPTGRCNNENLPSEKELLSFMNSAISQKVRFHHTLYKTTCPAFSDRIFIDWNGDIFGCGWVGKNKSVGNISELKLNEIKKTGHYCCPLWEWQDTE